jgi:hypothetical protein
MFMDSSSAAVNAFAQFAGRLYGPGALLDPCEKNISFLKIRAKDGAYADTPRSKAVIVR